MSDEDGRVLDPSAEGVTVVDAVDSHLERDPELVDVLMREIASLRRTARWLIEENGWDATEEAVVSALRRYPDRQP